MKMKKIIIASILLTLLIVSLGLFLSYKVIYKPEGVIPTKINYPTIINKEVEVVEPKKVEVVEPEEQKIANVTPYLEIEEFYTDKEVYYSDEVVTLTLKINSSHNLEDVGIKIYGILDRWGNYRLSIKQKTNFKSGKNMLDFSYRTPSCYGCAGLDPGIYELISLITYNEISVNKTISIEIKP